MSACFAPSEPNFAEILYSHARTVFQPRDRSRTTVSDTGVSGGTIFIWYWLPASRLSSIVSPVRAPHSVKNERILVIRYSSRVPPPTTLLL